MSTLITKAFENFSNEYLKHNSATIEQHKVIDCILACKTGRLGYNIQACVDCGTIHSHYNSCGNRHCPNCQAIKKNKWILSKQNDAIPVKYYHTVFTVPAEIRTLFKFNKKLLYNLLFKCAWETIDDFSANPDNKIQAKMGMIAILHTWKQDLDYHPHLHCIIPAGGITANNKWKSSPSNGDYLFNVEALGVTFKAKMLYYLKQYQKDKLLNYWNLNKQRPSEYFYNLKEELYSKDWVVYSKESFENYNSVFEYLGRYTHKIAISNSRIISVTETHVSFEYTDRADNYKKKIRILKGQDFIKLFLQHVLPSRFMKIRSYGILSSRIKTDALTKLHEYFNLEKYEKPVMFTSIELMELLYNIKPGVCKDCGGKLIVIEAKGRNPPRASPKVA